MANLVTYAKQKWEDAKTAITAARLNNMEDGISNCATQINALGDSVSPLTYQRACEVQFICTDKQFGIQVTDKETGNMGFISIRNNSEIYANVRINNVWVRERTL